MNDLLNKVLFSACPMQTFSKAKRQPFLSFSLKRKISLKYLHKLWQSIILYRFYVKSQVEIFEMFSKYFISLPSPSTSSISSCSSSFLSSSSLSLIPCSCQTEFIFRLKSKREKTTWNQISLKTCRYLLQLCDKYLIPRLNT